MTEQKHPPPPEKVGPCGGDQCRLTAPRESDGARFCWGCDSVIYPNGRKL